MLAISPTSSIVKPPSAALTATRSIRPRRISIPSDRLRSGLRIRESLLETTDFLSIDCVGMKSRSRRWRTRNLRLELELMLLKLVEFHLKARSRRAFSYCLDHRGVQQTRWIYACGIYEHDRCRLFRIVCSRRFICWSRRVLDCERQVLDQRRQKRA